MFFETASVGWTVLILLVIGILWFMIVADGDLALMFVERFGKPVDSLRGQVAWVTGAGSGIGEALSVILAQNGVRLVISDINVDLLGKVRKECLEKSQLKPDQILVIPFDIIDATAQKESLAKVLDHFGQVDLMFHNAGRTLRAEYANITSDVDKSIFDVNCFGHVALSRLVLPHFLQNGRGQFIVTSSMLGKCAIPRASSYVASKHALIGYFESLSLEYCQRGVEVTIICPGPVFSGLYNQCYTEKAGEFLAAGMQSADRRMKASRCAHLMALSAANSLEESWPCIQPALVAFYAAQYAPTIYKRVAKRFINPENIDALRDGRKSIF